MRRQGFHIYFMVIILLLFAAIWVSLMSRQSVNFTRMQFDQALAEGKVSQILIQQNEEVPTGSVLVEMNTDQGVQRREFFVTDVKEIEAQAMAAGDSCDDYGS